MNHVTLNSFWKHYGMLSKDVQELADKNFALLEVNPRHPSLHFKKVGGMKALWSVRVGLDHRALGREKPDHIAWYWIGSHAEYDKLLAS